VASSDFVGQASNAVLGYLLTALSLELPEFAPIAQSLVLLWQKAGHVVLFGVLGLLAVGEPDQFRRRLLLAAGGVICLVAEYLQMLTETRQLSAADAVINMGAFVSAAILFQRHSRRKANQ
jgi:VanZ family protein